MIYAVMWLAIVAGWLVSHRMMSYHKREAMFWLGQLRTLTLLDELEGVHPEYKDAYDRLRVALKAEGDIRVMKVEDMSGWDKLRDGGRLPDVPA